MKREIERKEERGGTCVYYNISPLYRASFPYLKRPEVFEGREVEAVVPKDSHQVRGPKHRISPFREVPVSY